VLRRLCCWISSVMLLACAGESAMTTRNNYGSAIAYSLNAPSPQNRILPIGQAYRLIDIPRNEDPQSWVVTLNGLVKKAAGVFPRLEATVTWGSGGVTHSAQVSVYPGTIVSVAGEKVFVDVKASLWFPAGVNPDLECELSASAHRSFADSTPTLATNITACPKDPVSGDFQVPVPPFAKSFYVGQALDVALGAFAAGTVYTQLAFGNGAQQVNGTTVRAIKDHGEVINILPNVTVIDVTNGGGGPAGDAFIVFQLDI
jgi:hypothetical protein